MRITRYLNRLSCICACACALYCYLLSASCARPSRDSDWLRPLDDGSLPNLNLRTALYKLLDELHIEEADLRGSQRSLFLICHWRCECASAHVVWCVAVGKLV